MTLASARLWVSTRARKFFRIFLWFCLLLAVVVILINSIIYVTTKPYIYSDITKIPTAQTVIVPGAAILPNGVLSPIFIDRIDMAIKLYKANKVSKILISGDNSTDIYNEVNPARLYLISKEVPDKDIFLDHAGFDTYSTMYRARDIFGVTSIIISSQSFHLPRAVFLARSLGIKSYGMNADVGHIYLRNYFREIIANEKAVLNLIFHIKPKYLGDKVPVAKDGRNYP